MRCDCSRLLALKGLASVMEHDVRQLNTWKPSDGYFMADHVAPLELSPTAPLTQQSLPFDQIAQRFGCTLQR